jgi:uncharacterized protein
MIDRLDGVGVRVLGSLIEKEITTPDNYPLTLNSLTAACNQSSNRDPVMNLDEAAVLDTVKELTRRKLVNEVFRSDSRAKRYRQVFSEFLSLHAPETAIMCVLMLRGPQTTGELRTRAERMFKFVDLNHVEITLNGLMTMSTPLVVQLPRMPGQKEVRYAHLLSGEPEYVVPEPDPRASRPAESPDSGRVEALENEVASLRGEVAELRASFEEFRKQFQ